MAKMNVRKLIRFGKNSYVISLPKQWVDKTKLKKGDLISIDETKEGLVLKTNSAEVKEEPKSIVINAENNAEKNGQVQQPGKQNRKAAQGIDCLDRARPADPPHQHFCDHRNPR